MGQRNMTPKGRPKKTAEPQPLEQIAVHLVSGNTQTELVISGAVQAPILGLPIMREDFVTATGPLIS